MTATITATSRRVATAFAARIELAALALALLPIVVAVVRAIVVDWTPVGDAAYFTIRSRDVLTDHHPLLGAWSSSSRTLGDDINNLGPLQLDLLAPFTKLDPYWGTAVGVGVTNAAAVVCVWLVVRRLFAETRRRRRVATIGAMIAIVALEATIGSLQLVEARQQFAMLMPFWALLWLTAALATGAWWSLPPSAFVASLLLQTHFTYAYHVAALVIVGLVGFVVATPRDWRTRRPLRPLAVTAAVLLIAWAQPLWDQLARSGNLRHALTEASGSEGAPGFEYGVRSVADATLMPPFWRPGTMDGFLRTPLGISTTTAALAVVLWVAALVAVFVVARRTRSPVGAMAVVGLVALAGAIYTTAQIPPTLASVVPANYMWNWPIAIFMTTVVAAGILLAVRSIPRTDARRAVRVWMVPAGLAVAALVALVPALDTSDGFAEYAAEDGMGRRSVRPLVDQLSESLAELDIDGPVLIDRHRQNPLSYANYTILAELQRHGIGFQFRPGETDLRRFGRQRCADGTASHRIVFATGPQHLQPLEGETTLARVDAMSERDVRTLQELNGRFGELLREGQIEVKTEVINALGYQRSAHLMTVLRDPDEPALPADSHYLQTMRRYGVVVVPGHLEDDLERWRALAERMVQDRMAIFLAPITGADRGDRCPD